jgi:hypothetical protein
MDKKDAAKVAQKQRNLDKYTVHTVYPATTTTESVV